VTDTLTGLANRRGIDQHMRREVARVLRHGYRLSFVLLDIDHFKKVNDRFGHGMGDEVLRRVADTMSRTLRASDLAARWGGEEFLVVLTDTGLDGARMCAERIRAAVEALSLPRVSHVTISAGVAELTSGEDLSVALLRADDWRRELELPIRGPREKLKAAAVHFAASHWANHPQAIDDNQADAFCLAWVARQLHQKSLRIAA